MWFARWRIGNTYINGKRLRFEGRATQYFIKSLIWFLLSIATIGIYAMLFLPLRRQQFMWENTYIDDYDTPGWFSAGVAEYFVQRFLWALISIITLGWGTYYATMKLERWRYTCITVGDIPLSFTARGMQYFVKSLIWALLGAITIQIYTIFFLPVAIQRFYSEHTFIEGEERN